MRWRSKLSHGHTATLHFAFGKVEHQNGLLAGGASLVFPKGLEEIQEMQEAFAKGVIPRMQDVNGMSCKDASTFGSRLSFFNS